jgi:hypothetical protein
MRRWILPFAGILLGSLPSGPLAAEARWDMLPRLELALDAGTVDADAYRVLSRLEALEEPTRILVSPVLTSIDGQAVELVGKGFEQIEDEEQLRSLFTDLIGDAIYRNYQKCLDVSAWLEARLSFTENLDDRLLEAQLAQWNRTCDRQAALLSQAVSLVSRERKQLLLAKIHAIFDAYGIAQLAPTDPAYDSALAEYYKQFQRLGVTWLEFRLSAEPNRNLVSGLAQYRAYNPTQQLDFLAFQGPEVSLVSGGSDLYLPPQLQLLSEKAVLIKMGLSTQGIRSLKKAPQGLLIPLVVTADILQDASVLVEDRAILNETCVKYSREQGLEACLP